MYNWVFDGENARETSNQERINQRQEILDRINYFYRQVDGTHAWPNSAEGDILKMVYNFLGSEK